MCCSPYQKRGLLTKLWSCWGNWMLHLVKCISRVFDSAFRQLIHFSSLRRPSWFSPVHFVRYWIEILKMLLCTSTACTGLQIGGFHLQVVGAFSACRSQKAWRIFTVPGPQVSCFHRAQSLCLFRIILCTYISNPTPQFHSPDLYCKKKKKQFKRTRTNLGWMLFKCHVTIN